MNQDKLLLTSPSSLFQCIGKFEKKFIYIFLINCVAEVENSFSSITLAFQTIVLFTLSLIERGTLK